MSVYVYLIDPSKSDKPPTQLLHIPFARQGAIKATVERGKKYIVVATAWGPGVQGESHHTQEARPFSTGSGPKLLSQTATPRRVAVAAGAFVGRNSARCV